MRVLILGAVLAAAVTATVLRDEKMDRVEWLIGKDNLDAKDVKTKEVIIMKLLNHILQPSVYRDVRDCARDFSPENNMDKFMKPEAVKVFLDMYTRGMLPRGEIFVHTSEKQMKEAIKVFKVLWWAKDFDTFIRCACWMRERINEGMFVYAMTVAVMHREDCKGVVLPAPYEIYPYFFVNSDVIHKAFMMKMKKGAVDRVLLDNFNIRVTDKNVVVIDSRKDVRHTMSAEDRLAYFTEDIDLNTYFYYFWIDYPSWMVDDMYAVNKERRGEIMMYGMQQLLARMRLERLSHEMCQVKPLTLSKNLKVGYWPKIRMSNGEEMPARMNDVSLLTDQKVDIKRQIDDVERMIRDAIMTGTVTLWDGTVMKIRKAEDVEILCRLIWGTFHMKDDAKMFNLMKLLTKMITYNKYNMEKYTYVPTALDMAQTCLRDPVFWKIIKRVTDNVVLFKKMLPRYTREELDFPGVKIDAVTTDKLVTFFDDYDMDITNAVYLNEAEMKKEKSDWMFVARQRRMNHHPFKLTVDVVSDKTVDAVVRVFLGPKYDCMGRLLDLSDKRMDMVEIDSFIYKLETGKNVIVRDSMDMHNVIGDRPWSRKVWDRAVVESFGGSEHVWRESWWHRARTGFPHRLLLPMGRRGGLEMQLFVIVSPVRTATATVNNNMVDWEAMRQRKACRFTACMDMMPFGFPLDREIDLSRWWTNNMKLADVMIFHKDMDTINVSKNVDFSNMVMKRDDFTWMDKDMLVSTRYRDPMAAEDDQMLRM